MAKRGARNRAKDDGGWGKLIRDVVVILNADRHLEIHFLAGTVDGDTVGGSDKAKDLFGLYEDTLARLLAIPR